MFRLKVLFKLNNCFNICLKSNVKSMATISSLTTINKLITSKILNQLNPCQHLRHVSKVGQNISLKNRKYGLIYCTSVLMATAFGYNYLFCHYLRRSDDYLTNSLTQLLSIFQIKRCELFIENKDIDNSSDDSSLPSKRFNFIADVSERVCSAVVFIDIKGRHPFAPNLTVSVSSGSGFLVNSSGLILTNAHVVANYKNVSVKLHDGRVVNGFVECVDERLDLATVKIDQKDLPFIKLGDSRKSRPGEWVLAMGSPFSLSNTLTVGVISSVSRAGKELGLYRQEMDYIQTDAAINIGNSGGPLVNLDGEAIGINTMKVTAGISFAIPSVYAIDFLEKAERLRQKRFITNKKNAVQTKIKRYIGITMLTLTPKLIEQLQSKEADFPDVQNGVLVWRVVLGSPAHLEGLEPGDVITKINNKTASSANDIYEALESDQTLIFTVKRKNREIKLAVNPQIVE